MKRRLAALLAVAVVAAAAYAFLARDEAVAPRLLPTRATSVIGSGSDAVGVSPEGVVLSWLPAPEEELPRLPLEAPPRRPRLAGPALEQARVLGAAPAALRPYVERSYYGESGVDVVLSNGIELRFGDDSQAARKWRAAAAVLADPSLTALDSVDLHAPSHPAIRGSGHSLPPAR